MLVMPLFGVIPEARSVLLLPLVALGLLFAASLVSAAFVLPSVALGHWMAQRRGSGRRGWWVLASALLVSVLVVSLSLLVVASRGEGPVFSSWRGSLVWLLYASVFCCVSMPAVLAAHRVVVRAEAGYRVWSAGQVLGYGAVLLLVELMGVLVVLSVLV
ncbi:hypothetical protein [Streptomyces sp. NPDC046925]|uniref:hypothetical protein n=1 Tax=Streptomyces sp. NPDC046925 TaxID=3155375 RepID=UPI0033C9AC06